MIIAVCASRRAIRGREGQWLPIQPVELIAPGVLTTHGICPDCVQALYGGHG